MCIIELEIPDDMREELRALEVLCGMDLQTLNNEALALLQWAVRRTAEGNQVGSANISANKFTELQMEFMKNIKSVKNTLTLQ